MLLVALAATGANAQLLVSDEESRLPEGPATPWLAANGSRIVPREEAAERWGYLARVSEAFRYGSTCYAAHLTEAQMAEAMARYELREPVFGPVGVQQPQFTTATPVWTGAGLQASSGQGKRASLTYSFPADGVTWGGQAGFAAAPNALNASFTTGFGAGNIDKGRELVRQAFGAWRRYGGIDYQEVADSGIAYDLVTTRRSTVGDVRIGGSALGTSTGVLAYDMFPNNGSDMVINTSYMSGTFNDSTNLYRSFRNCVAHEHGHGLGFIHQVPCDSTKLMEPQLATAFDVLNLDDRRGAGRNYGDRYSGNGSVGAAKDLGNLTTPLLRSVIENDLSTNGNSGPNGSNADWFKFTIDTPQDVVITATAVGGTYTTGQQSSGCSGTTASVAAQTAGNLNIELRTGNGSGIVQTASGSAAGIAESLTATSLAAGTYTVRVYDAGPNGAADEIVQLYNLAVRVGSAPALPYANAGVHKRVQANTNCYLMGNINSAATEPGTTLTAFAWDLDNNGVFEANGGQISRQYVTNGTFNATLRVTADTSPSSMPRTSTDTITVTVTGATPAVTSISPASGLTGATVPIVINGKDFVAGTTVSISGSGVSLLGTATPNYLGTQITGLSVSIPAGSTPGAYTISVANPDGTAGGTFTVNQSITCPTVTTQPSPQAGVAGQPITLTVVAAGDNLVYQWYKGFNPMSDGGTVSGSNSASMVISSATFADAGNYSVEISNSCRVISSVVVAVTVDPPPVCPDFSAQPSGLTVNVGQPVTFSVIATGTAPLTYHWFHNTLPVTDGGTLSGAGTNMLTISSAALADAGDYTVSVTNACGSVTSGFATLVVLNENPAACSLADITGIGGPPAVPDGLITGDDFNAFISAFANDDLLADVTGIGGPPAVPDGLITGDDFNAFIVAFAAGCP